MFIWGNLTTQQRLKSYLVSWMEAGLVSGHWQSLGGLDTNQNGLRHCEQSLDLRYLQAGKRKAAGNRSLLTNSRGWRWDGFQGLGSLWNRWQECALFLRASVSLAVFSVYWVCLAHTIWFVSYRRYTFWLGLLGSCDINWRLYSHHKNKSLTDVKREMLESTQSLQEHTFLELNY